DPDEGGLGRAFLAGDGFTKAEGLDGDGNADLWSLLGAGNLEAVGLAIEENFGMPEDFNGVAEVEEGSIAVSYAQGVRLVCVTDYYIPPPSLSQATWIMNATEPPTPSLGQGDTTPPSLNPQTTAAVATSSSSSPSPASDTFVLSEHHVQQAQPDELRAIIARLMPLVQEARSDAAHHKLQYHMLAIETNEAMERIQVEMDMAQRETDLLKANDPVEPRISRADHHVDPSIRRVHADIWDSMVKESQTLKSQNVQLEQLVSQHKRMIVQQESEIATLNDRITLYRERLRENRAHLNRYRRTAGFPESPRKTQSAQSSPWTTREQDQPPFAALLHASDLISGRSTADRAAIARSPIPALKF
ncbi:hypothetical protein KCU79_g21163, partial [Aureobasidium melanogenum]